MDPDFALLGTLPYCKMGRFWHVVDDTDEGQWSYATGSIVKTFELTVWHLVHPRSCDADRSSGCPR